MLKKWDANWAKEVNFFSDACPGRNRNWNALALFQAFVSLEAKHNRLLADLVTIGDILLSGCEIKSFYVVVCCNVYDFVFWQTVVTLGSSK